MQQKRQSKGNISYILLTLFLFITIAIAASCGGGGGEDGGGGGSTPIPSGTLLFTATSNPSTGTDIAWGIAIDSTYKYVVGHDSSPGNAQWRIEKRNLSDGALAAGFGAGGVVTIDPSLGVDIAYAIAIDSTYMYVVGIDYSHGNAQWRIEKRTK